MGAIGLNPIRLDRIGLDPIRINAIRLGVPGAASGSDRPYIDPEVFASLKAVCICYGKSNDDPDRAIVKNLVDPDNPFIISNAAYKLNSGYGKYGMDFLEWKSNSGMSFTSTKLTSTKPNLSGGWLTFRNVSGLIPETKVKVSGAPREFGFIANNNGTDDKFSVTINNGVYTIPEFTLSSASGFYINNNSGDWSNLVIEQIPSFEGAFVTDGIDDLITSTKTVQEMLGGSNEITVVSMIHLVQTPSASSEKAYTNQIRTGQNYLRNYVTNNGKTGIYGYTYKGNNVSVINNILGDKNDYTVENKSWNNLAKFSVIGYEDNGTINELDQVAWYWTIIANKVLTTDQINQVIAYFNLDRTLKPDIYCDIAKQGITNDNHADFNDKLIDYSGNGRDIQMNNLAWKGGSGIAAKQYETFKDWLSETSSTSIITQIDEFTRIVESTTNGYWISRIRRDSDLDKVYDPINVYLYQDNNFLIHECKYEVDGVKYSIPIYESVGKGYHKLEIYTKDRYTELPENAEKVVLSEWYFPKSNKGSIKYSVIPSHKGGILLDGITDFGKVTGMPIYKDYTFIIDRQIISIGDTNGIVASKSEDSTDVNKQGAFLFEYLGGPNNVSTWSFYKDNGKVANTDFTRGISYQSKYSYNGIELLAGTAFDSDKLWLGTLRDKDSRFANVAIYSLMSFPYSMSKFLIERQLKKHKLGTLYPDMAEWRPIVKSNVPYKNIVYTILGTSTQLVVGQHYPVSTKVRMTINTIGKVDEVSLVTINGQEAEISRLVLADFVLTSKSPQKIDITIDEYIRYEDIVQPYPVLLRFNDENGNEVSWGGKFRVGSTITRIGSAADSNLLPNIYNIFGLLLNGNQVTSSKVIVEKTMVFKAKSAYIFDNNEPKCVLSPSRLRIPNSSYKILGYIPDISGHGNNGVINNSAYAGMSGANGYPNNFNSYTIVSGVTKTDSSIKVEKELSGSGWFLSIPANMAVASMKLNIDGIPSNKTVKWATNVEGIGDITLINGVNEIPAYTSSSVSGIYTIYSDLTGLSIQQIGEYEGAYCLDGVDDFITIPTTVGGKQVLMKVNWQSSIGQGMLYDQRGYANEFAIWNSNSLNDNEDDVLPAYSARNNGQTYIDGILNNNIKASELRAITHNITITNELSSGVNNTYPVIGANKTVNAYFANMSLYDFMLFDEISTDEEILTLNEYVGIEGNTDDLFTENN